MAPDFTVGCIEYADGVVARVTCSLVAPRDKSLTVIGDDGVLVGRQRAQRRLPDLCAVDTGEPLAGSDRTPRQQIERVVPRLGRRNGISGADTQWRASARAVSPATTNRSISAAVRQNWPMPSGEKRPCRLSPELGWHIAELIERLQYPERFRDRQASGVDLRSHTTSASRSLAPHARLDPHSLLQRRAMGGAGDRKRTCTDVAGKGSHCRRRRFNGPQPGDHSPLRRPHPLGNRPKSGRWSRAEPAPRARER